MEWITTTTYLTHNRGPRKVSIHLGHNHPRHIPDGRTPGQRAADRTAAIAGSWPFIWSYVLLTFLWILTNLLLWPFDPYPFILYTMAVSVLAILMSSLILLASNRQSQIDRAHAENAYHQVMELLQLQHNQMEILQLLQEIHMTKD